MLFRSPPMALEHAQALRHQPHALVGLQRHRLGALAGQLDFEMPVVRADQLDPAGRAETQHAADLRCMALVDGLGGNVHVVRAGKGIVLVSSELGELLGMSDRITMLCEGAVGGTFTRAEASQERLLAAAMGRSEQAA